MSRLSPAHIGDATSSPDITIDPSGLGVNLAAIPDSAIPASVAGDPNVFLITLPKGIVPDNFPALAIKTCGERPYCKFMAWADGSKTAPKLPLSSAQVATMSFSYLRDQNQGFAKALWNCAQYRRPSPVQCMRVQTLGAPPVAPVVIEPPATRPDGSLAGPAGLIGVRRKGDPTPAAKPTPGAKPAVTFTIPAPRGTPAAAAPAKN
jgi:hypothetical protein